MSHASSPPPGSATGRPTLPPSAVWPTARSGWFALAVEPWVWVLDVMPIVTTLIADTFPVTDAVAMPIGLFVIGEGSSVHDPP